MEAWRDAIASGTQKLLSPWAKENHWNKTDGRITEKRVCYAASAVFGVLTLGIPHVLYNAHAWYRGRARHSSVVPPVVTGTITPRLSTVASSSSAPIVARGAELAQPFLSRVQERRNTLIKTNGLNAKNPQFNVVDSGFDRRGDYLRIGDLYSIETDKQSLEHAIKAYEAAGGFDSYMATAARCRLHRLGFGEKPTGEDITAAREAIRDRMQSQKGWPRRDNSNPFLHLAKYELDLASEGANPQQLRADLIKEAEFALEAVHSYNKNSFMNLIYLRLSQDAKDTATGEYQRCLAQIKEPEKYVDGYSIV